MWLSVGRVGYEEGVCGGMGVCDPSVGEGACACVVTLWGEWDTRAVWGVDMRSRRCTCVLGGGLCEEGVM